MVDFEDLEGQHRFPYPVVKIDITFGRYCDIMREKVLDFDVGYEWNQDEWNDSYVDFREGISIYRKSFIESHTAEELVIDWARGYYSPATQKTHTYWLKNE